MNNRQLYHHRLPRNNIESITEKKKKTFKKIVYNKLNIHYFGELKCLLFQKVEVQY